MGVSSCTLVSARAGHAGISTGHGDVAVGVESRKSPNVNLLEKARTGRRAKASSYRESKRKHLRNGYYSVDAAKAISQCTTTSQGCFAIRKKYTLIWSPRRLVSHGTQFPIYFARRQHVDASPWPSECVVRNSDLYAFLIPSLAKGESGDIGSGIDGLLDSDNDFSLPGNRPDLPTTYGRLIL